MGQPTPLDHCLRCDYLFDEASALVGGKDARPKPGDFTICLKCGHAMAFDKTRHVRELTIKERRELLGILARTFR